MPPIFLLLRYFRDRGQFHSPIVTNFIFLMPSALCFKIKLIKCFTIKYSFKALTHSISILEKNFQASLKIYHYHLLLFSHMQGHGSLQSGELSFEGGFSKSQFTKQGFVIVAFIYSKSSNRVNPNTVRPRLTLFFGPK